MDTGLAQWMPGWHNGCRAGTMDAGLAQWMPDCRNGYRAGTMDAGLAQWMPDWRNGYRAGTKAVADTGDSVNRNGFQQLHQLPPTLNVGSNFT